MKSIVLYVYYEKDETYKKNLQYFLEHAVNDESEFLFIINGECSIDIMQRHNVSVHKRQNIGYDFGAWSDALQFINKDEYEYFIFINTSVYGPFIQNPTPNKCWQDYLLQMIVSDTKLVGTTINISHDKFNLLQQWEPPYTHVQSQVFAMDKECLDFLHNKIFTKFDTIHTFYDIIQLKEITMSQLVLKNGWNINCLLPKYKGLDYRIIKQDINFSSFQGDACKNGCYFGGTITPYDVMFIKANRNLNTLDAYDYIHNYMNSEMKNNNQKSKAAKLVVICCKNPRRIFTSMISYIKLYYPDFDIVIIDCGSDKKQMLDQIHQQYNDIIIEYVNNTNYELGAWYYAFHKYNQYDIYMFLQDNVIPSQRINGLENEILDENVVYSCHYNTTMQDGGYLQYIYTIYKDTDLDFISKISADHIITVAAYTSFIANKDITAKVLQLESIYQQKNLSKSEIDSCISEKTVAIVLDSLNCLRKDMKPYVYEIL
jgi:hypothetical protein